MNVQVQPYPLWIRWSEVDRARTDGSTVTFTARVVAWTTTGRSRNGLEPVVTDPRGFAACGVLAPGAVNVAYLDHDPATSPSPEPDPPASAYRSDPATDT